MQICTRGSELTRRTSLPDQRLELIARALGIVIPCGSVSASPAASPRLLMAVA